MRKRRSQRGIVLLFTLAIIIILAVLILEFNYSSRVDLNIAYQLKDSLQAELLVKSAVAVAGAALRDDEDLQVDTLQEDWAAAVPETAAGGGSVQVRLSDEERKLNVTTEKDPVRLQDQLERLLRTLGKDPAVAQRIMAHLPYADPEQLRRCVNDDEVFACLTTIGKGTVNINTASAPVLRSLSERLTGPVSDRIIAFRSDAAYRDITQLSQAYQYDKPQDLPPELFNDIKNDIGVNSRDFWVEASARVGSARKIIAAVIRREGAHCRVLYWRDQTYE